MVWEREFLEIVGGDIVEVNMGEEMVGVGVERDMEEGVVDVDVGWEEGEKRVDGVGYVEGWGRVIVDGVGGEKGGVGVVNVVGVVGEWGVEGIW